MTSLQMETVKHDDIFGFSVWADIVIFFHTVAVVCLNNLEFPYI